MRTEISLLEGILLLLTVGLAAAFVLPVGEIVRDVRRFGVRALARSFFTSMRKFPLQFSLRALLVTMLFLPAAIFVFNEELRGRVDGAVAIGWIMFLLFLPLLSVLFGELFSTLSPGVTAAADDAMKRLVSSHLRRPFLVFRRGAGNVKFETLL